MKYPTTLGFLFSFCILPHIALASEIYVDSIFNDISDIQDLANHGLDIVGVDHERKVVTILFDDTEFNQIRSLPVIGSRQLVAPDSQYKNPRDVADILEATGAKYPELAEVQPIGKSVEGRDILAVHLTNHKITGPKPSLVFDAMHHAREIMTPEVALDIVDYLTKNYATDEKVRKWMDSYDIWVVPMLNPDGNNKVWTSQSLWRKNNRGGYGVDINRNYLYEWNTCNGSSSNKSAQDYRGDKAGSEPETNALMDLVKKVQPMFNISYHSTSEIVIYPFGCKPKHLPEPDRKIYEDVGRELAKKLVRDSGNGNYTAGTSYELLYNVDGGSIDWMYDSNKTMAFVIEMNSSSQGFQPSYNKWRDSTVQRQRAGWMYILDRMSGPGIK